MSSERPTIYENEEGDYWVRVDQAPTEEAALTALQAFTGPDIRVVAYGIETVPLSEAEVGDPKSRPGRKRRAWHFQDLVMA